MYWSCDQLYRFSRYSQKLFYVVDIRNTRVIQLFSCLFSVGESYLISDAKLFTFIYFQLRRVTWWTRNEPIEETHVSKDTKINGDVREDNLSNSQTSINTKLAVSQTSMKEKSETMIVNGHSSPIIEASLEKKIAQGVSDASDGISLIYDHIISILSNIYHNI